MTECVAVDGVEPLGVLNKINGRLDTAGKKMGDLEDIARETIQNVRHTEKNSKNKEQTEEHQ